MQLILIFLSKPSIIHILLLVIIKLKDRVFHYIIDFDSFTLIIALQLPSTSLIINILSLPSQFYI